MSEILYGRNAVRESLRARRRHVHRVLLAENSRSSEVIEEIKSLAGALKRPVNEVRRKALDKVGRGHQGVAMECGRYPTVSLEDILKRAAKADEPPFLLVADHIEDPHNLGAILRTADVVGVHGVVIPKQRAVGVTPAVVNASAGAVEHLWVAEVPNLTQSLKWLKQRDVWIAGVENSPQAGYYHQANLAGAIALVVGSEGKGMSRLVQDTCDFLVKLPMMGRVESLNASVAAGLMLYEVRRTRGFA